MNACFHRFRLEGEVRSEGRSSSGSTIVMVVVVVVDVSIMTSRTARDQLAYETPPRITVAQPDGFSFLVVGQKFPDICVAIEQR